MAGEGHAYAFVLRSTKPLHVIEANFVFKNQEGKSIDADKWRGQY